MKIKGKRGFRFIKELGGAIRRETVSKTARFLEEHGLVRGRVLDYGCGFGLDADAMSFLGGCDSGSHDKEKD